MMFKFMAGDKIEHKKTKKKWIVVCPPDKLLVGDQGPGYLLCVPGESGQFWAVSKELCENAYKKVNVK